MGATSLPERLQEVIEQTKDALAVCRTIDNRPNLGLSIMEHDIVMAEKALISNDPVAMIRCVKELEEYLK